MPLRMDNSGRWGVGDKVLRIPLSDLIELEFTCKCGTGLVLSLLDESKNLPFRCPTCGIQFDGEIEDSLQRGLIRYRAFHRTMTKNYPNQAFFRIKE